MEHVTINEEPNCRSRAVISVRVDVPFRVDGRRTERGWGTVGVGEEGDGRGGEGPGGRGVEHHILNNESTLSH